jgi:hypothetical protein
MSVQVKACFWLLCAVAPISCQNNPYQIGRFVDDGCAAHEDAIFCSGFERPDLSEWTETIVQGSATVAQTELLRRSGRGALYAASTAEESAAVVSLEFPAISQGELFLRVHLYVPEGLATQTTNILFLGDYASPDPFKGIDFNLEDGAPQIFTPESAPDRYTSSSLVIPRDRWFCFQVRLLISETDGLVQLSVDGSVGLDQSELDTLPPGGVHLLRAGVDWSSKQTTPFAVYMDDLVLSRTPVACEDP